MSTTKETNYTFWIETSTGEEIYWDRLSKRQAEVMYNATQKSVPVNLKRWGWGASEALKWADLPLNAATTN